MDSKFTWRHQYDEEADAFYGQASQIVNDDPSLTQQHFAKEADINEIMRRFGVTDGSIPPAAIDPKFFGDFTDVPDFRQALDNTREAAERFNALPAELRARFHNDPVELWQFVTDPRNADQSVELGLLKREAKPAPAIPPAPAPPEG